MIFNKILLAVRRSKIFYFIVNYIRKVVPASLFQGELKKKLSAVKGLDIDYVNSRLNYYNKLSRQVEVGDTAVLLSEMKAVVGPSAYFFDTYMYTRYFDQNFKANFLFKDVIHTPDVPTLQKSRPISDNNDNAVILKMDRKRHFLFVNDPYQFLEKKDLLIGRSSISPPNSPQPHRVRFMEMYFCHPICDLGQVNKVGGNPDWLKPRISIIDHLKYKFILSLEGNDVATNLKWIMSSNSIAVMPAPRYETWFMEGKLLPDFHFICIQSDYSDLEYKLRYYIDHPNEAQQIISNANEYVRQFMNSRVENLVSMLVLQKYFYQTRQLSDNEFIGIG